MSHHVLAPEQRWRRVSFERLASGSPEEVADDSDRRQVDEGRLAGHGGPVDEGQQEQVARLVAEVAEEPIARSPGHRAGLGEVHGPQVVAHQALQHVDHPLGQAQPLADGPGALGADDVVLEEPDAPADHLPRLRLGHVVQQRGELQRLARDRSRRPAPRACARQLVAERARAREAREQAVGAGQRAQECSSTAKRWGAGWVVARIGSTSGNTTREEPEGVHPSNCARRAVRVARIASNSSRTRSAETPARSPA